MSQLAVLALDVVGLIVAVVDFDVALIDRAPDIGKRLGDAALGAAMNILIMAVPPKRARF